MVSETYAGLDDVSLAAIAANKNVSRNTLNSLIPLENCKEATLIAIINSEAFKTEPTAYIDNILTENKKKYPLSGKTSVIAAVIDSPAFIANMEDLITEIINNSDAKNEDLAIAAKKTIHQEKLTTIAKHPNAESNTLIAVVEKSTRVATLKEAASNNNADLDTLRKIAKHHNAADEDVLTAVANRETSLAEKSPLTTEDNSASKAITNRICDAKLDRVLEKTTAKTENHALKTTTKTSAGGDSDCKTYDLFIENTFSNTKIATITRDADNKIVISPEYGIEKTAGAYDLIQAYKSQFKEAMASASSHELVKNALTTTAENITLKEQKTFNFTSIEDMYQDLKSTASIDQQKLDEYAHMIFNLNGLQGDDLKTMEQKRVEIAAKFVEKIKALNITTEATFTADEGKQLLTSMAGKKDSDNTSLKLPATDEKDPNGKPFDAKIVREKTLGKDTPVAYVTRETNAAGEGPFKITLAKQGGLDKNGKPDKSKSPSPEDLDACVRRAAEINSSKGKTSLSINNCVSDAQIECSLLESAMLIKKYSMSVNIDDNTQKALADYDSKNPGENMTAKFNAIKDMEPAEFKEKHEAALLKNKGDPAKAIQDMIENIEIKPKKDMSFSGGP